MPMSAPASASATGRAARQADGLCLRRYRLRHRKRAIKEDDPTTSRPDFRSLRLEQAPRGAAARSLAAQDLNFCTPAPSSIYARGMPEKRMWPRCFAKARRGEDLRLVPPVRAASAWCRPSDVCRRGGAGSQEGGLGNLQFGGPDRSRSPTSPTPAFSVADVARSLRRGRCKRRIAQVRPGFQPCGSDVRLFTAHRSRRACDEPCRELDEQNNLATGSSRGDTSCQDTIERMDASALQSRWWGKADS